MSISGPFIVRAIATSLLMFAIFLAGLLAYQLLPIASLPEVEYPTMKVVTFYPGASPAVMNSSVTAPLEKQFGQMPGLDKMNSASSMGASVITLQFSLSTTLDVAEQEVQAAINAALNYLPTDLPNPPIYSKVNPADTPIMTLALTSKNLSLTQVEDFAETQLAQKISQLSGVGLVSISGGQRPAVRVQANPNALASYGLSLEDVRSAITTANLNAAKGSFDGPRLSYMIEANDQLLTANAYRPLIIAYQNNAPVRLQDVAVVIDGSENVMLAAWKNTQPAVILNIQRQPGANVIQVVDRIQQLLPNLQQSLPQGVSLSILTDRTNTIRASVHDVQFELIMAICLVVMVIFIFLRKMTATIIPAIAVPLALIGTLAVMYLLGFSLNNLTLMALTIATGFVVDDAIVMIENITRYIEMGETPLQAAIKGAKQIAFTIVSLTVSLIGVLIPLIFMGDLLGRLFREFALTLSVTILISAFVSLTLTPMMCSRMLRKQEDSENSWFALQSKRVFDTIIMHYRQSLSQVLNHQLLTLIIFFITILITGILFWWIPKGFFPIQDTGVIQGISEASQSISFTAMAKRQQELAKIVLSDPAVENLSSFIGIDGVNSTLNSGRMLITLKTLNARNASASEVIQRLRQKLEKVVGGTLFMQPSQDLTIDTRVSRTQYQLSLGGADAAAVEYWTRLLLQQLKLEPVLRDVASDQQNAGLQTYINIDRNAAYRLGIDPQSIDETLYDAFGQRQISTIFTQRNQYHVILEVLPELQQGLTALNNIYLHTGLSSATTSSNNGVGQSPTLLTTNAQTTSTAVATNGLYTTSFANSPASTTIGQAIPLNAFTTISQKTSPLVINRQGQFPVATISFNLAPSAALGEAVDVINRIKENLHIPDSIQINFEGTAQIFQSSLQNELWLILAAIIVVYIVLGVLYESYIHPLTILSTLPSAGMGALLGLWLTNHEFSVIALIGVILLIGIVMKNAIMMIDFALEQERVYQKSAQDAIYEAALLRFRPILMTTMASLFGAIPLALGVGMGSELRRPLGIAIIGGLLVSQMLTLYTTPVIYLAFDKAAKKIMTWRPLRRQNQLTSKGAL